MRERISEIASTVSLKTESASKSVVGEVTFAVSRTGIR